jgi:penicillin-binding protein 2
MDPNTGDVLALASSPAFDPNIFIPKLSLEENARLRDAVMRPEINRATQENYQPGSIFKIVVSLACLEEGLDPHQIISVPPDPQNPAKGHIYVGNRKFRDTAEPGNYDFKRAFLKSSNSYFITNGMKAGLARIVELGRRLHLGEKTDLPTGQEVSGFFPNEKTIRKGWFAGDTANLCIGQGRIDVTPLQIAVLTAAIANWGKVLWPRLVARIEPQDPLGGESTNDFRNGRIRDELGVSTPTLQIIRAAMLADVEDPDGTGKAARVDGIKICAKTGTAQVKDARGNLVDHITWFASFAPYESPRYVVVVMVEGGASGGGTCGPIAQKIYQAIQKMENQSKLMGSALAHKN